MCLNADWWLCLRIWHTVMARHLLRCVQRHYQEHSNVHPDSVALKTSVGSATSVWGNDGAGFVYVAVPVLSVSYCALMNSIGSFYRSAVRLLRRAEVELKPGVHDEGVYVVSRLLHVTQYQICCIYRYGRHCTRGELCSSALDTAGNCASTIHLSMHCFVGSLRSV